MKLHVARSLSKPIRQQLKLSLQQELWESRAACPNSVGTRYGHGPVRQKAGRVNFWRLNVPEEYTRNLEPSLPFLPSRHGSLEFDCQILIMEVRLPDLKISSKISKHRI